MSLKDVKEYHRLMRKWNKEHPKTLKNKKKLSINTSNIIKKTYINKKPKKIVIKVPIRGGTYKAPTIRNTITSQ